MLGLLQRMYCVQSQSKIDDDAIENGDPKSLKELVEPYLTTNFNLCKWIDEKDLDEDVTYNNLHQQMFVFIQGKSKNSTKLFGNIVVLNGENVVIFERKNADKDAVEKKRLDRVKFEMFSKNKTINQVYFDPTEIVDKDKSIQTIAWKRILTLSFLALQSTKGCLLYNFCASKNKSSMFNEIVISGFTQDNFEIETISGPRMNSLVNMVSNIILDAMKAQIWTNGIIYFDPTRSNQQKKNPS